MTFKEFISDLKKGNMDAWWVIIFLGLAVFIAITNI